MDLKYQSILIDYYFCIDYADIDLDIEIIMPAGDSLYGLL